MVDITGLIPLSVGGIIGVLIEVIVISAVLFISDRVLAHESSFKHSLIMALIAYLVVPIIISFAEISFAFSGFVIPLIVWIILGEALLKGERKKRLIAAAIAFVVYLILTFAGVPAILSGLIPF